MIDDYFEECKEEKKAPSKAGLRVFLYCTRETLSQYESGAYDDAKNKYSDTIKHTYAKMEEYWVNLLARSAPNAGAIFYTKNAFGYRDTVDHTSGGQPINFIMPSEITVKHQLIPPAQPAPTPLNGNADVTPLPAPESTPQ